MTNRSVVLATPSTGAVAAAAVPSLGNLDAYISAVNRLPMLSAEEETQLARDFKERQDVDAARTLVTSHLRLVVSVARQYLGYGLPHADLIQEGNIGLMKAVKRFDPERSVRLVSFALHWIKAEIHEYILKNWRLVKVATTKAQRKLFFNLRSMKKDLDTLTPEAVSDIAEQLNVREKDVMEMETRMTGQEVALEPQGDDDEAPRFGPAAYLAAPDSEPSEIIESCPGPRREQVAEMGQRPEAGQQATVTLQRGPETDGHSEEQGDVEHGGPTDTGRQAAVELVVGGFPQHPDGGDGGAGHGQPPGSVEQLFRRDQAHREHRCGHGHQCGKQRT